MKPISHPIFLHRWWHKCMSDLGNSNRMSALKQTMFSLHPEGQGGGPGTGRYSNAVVSDGMMFKKAVLTPEEIRGHKSQAALSRRVSHITLASDDATTQGGSVWGKASEGRDEGDAGGRGAPAGAKPKARGNKVAPTPRGRRREISLHYHPYHSGLYMCGTVCKFIP